MWFSSTVEVQLTVHARIKGSSAVSKKHGAVLVAKPSGESQVKTNGMWLELPSFEVIRGSSFTAVLYVNSQADGPFALGTWKASITHDSFFTLVKVTSQKYDVTLGSKTTTSFALTSTVKSTYSGTSDKQQLTGSKLQVAVLTFKVESGFKGKQAGFSLLIDALSSTANAQIVQKQSGQVFSRGGLQSTGSIVVVESSDVGLQAFVSDEQELVNVVSLGASSPSSSIVTRRINSCHTTGGTKCSESDAYVTDAPQGLVCKSQVSNVVHTQVVKGQCVVSFTKAETKGGDVEVKLSFSTFSVSTFFRVWYPEVVEISAVDTELNKIEVGSGGGRLREGHGYQNQLDYHVITHTHTNTHACGKATAVN